MHARQTPADRLDVSARTPHFVHVRGGATDVADNSFEILFPPQCRHFTNDRLLTARLDNAALMRGDRAECASAEASPHSRHRVFDDFVRGDRLRIAGVRLACVRQVVERVHGLLRLR